MFSEQMNGLVDILTHLCGLLYHHTPAYPSEGHQTRSLPGREESRIRRDQCPYSANPLAAWDMVLLGHLKSLPWGYQLWGEDGQEKWESSSSITLEGSSVITWCQPCPLPSHTPWSLTCYPTLTVRLGV